MLRAALLLILLAPFAAAEDPHACGWSPVGYTCAGGGVQGDCSSMGYSYDEVMLVTVAGYVFARGDSLCFADSSSSYEDDQIQAGAGSEVVAASVTWYRFSSHDEHNGDYAGCRMLLRVYSIVGPIVIHNANCPAEQDPPNPGWGSLLP